MVKNKIYTDQELLTFMKKGNQLAFESIFNKYAEDLYVYAHKKLKNKQESQDIVQDVFVSLFRQREEAAEIKNLASYLYKAVLNKVFDIYKHKYVVNEYNDVQVKNSGDHHYYVGTDFLIREKDLEQIIQNTIDKMPDRMREIFILKKFKHYSTKQIAEKLNISELTVSTQLKRATKLLKSSLTDFLVLMLFFMKD